MTALELGTRAAIWILIGGSIAVFAWFARDLLRLARSSPAKGMVGGPGERRGGERAAGGGRGGPGHSDDPLHRDES